MRTIVLGIFILLWILWVLPFILGKRRAPHGKPVVQARQARWGILLQGIAYALVFRFHTFWSRPIRWWLIIPAFAFGIVSVVCSWASVPALGKQWRIDAALNADHQLVRSGPYRIVRHPIYASMFGMFLAAGLIMTWWPVLLLAFAIFIVGIEIRVRTEDELLRSRFHEEFEAWKASVPAYIPFIR